MPLARCFELGDALRHAEFEDAPDLELVRHLRNAVAHGNRFEITHPQRLEERPAYQSVRHGPERRFEITPDLDGQPCLFEFMGPADVTGLLQRVGSLCSTGLRVSERSNVAG